MRQVDYDFDVIVIGSGAGGGTLAATVAAQGKRVLLLERGVTAPQASGDERTTLIDKRPYDDRRIYVNQRSSRVYMGSGPGGSTAVYGAALLRPSVDDFHPGRHYQDRLPRHLWDWPLDYHTLRPFYDQAEQLYHVAADTAGPQSPLEPSAGHADSRPLPLARINRQVVDRSRRAQLHPFRLPLAIDADRCLRCSHCAGFACPTGARLSSSHLIHRCIAAGHSLRLLSNREVTGLRRGDNRTSHVQVSNRTCGTLERYSARRYVIAAGAIGTPCILQRSGVVHRELGRNYMMHYSPLAAGLFARSTDADRTFVKQLGYADFYFGTADLPEKMGIVQSLPAPGPLMLRKSGLRYLPAWLLGRLRRHLLLLAGIVEDLPHRANRVECSPDGGIRLRHRFSDYDRKRGAALTRAMRHILRAAGAIHCVTRNMPSHEHVAHQCGTVRFGRSPRHAVADADCRLFGHDDVFVADGSILPTSLGVGPSLTLMANALRVAEIIQKEV